MIEIVTVDEVNQFLNCFVILIIGIIVARMKLLEALFIRTCSYFILVPIISLLRMVLSY